MEKVTNRWLIEKYMTGDRTDKTLSCLFLVRYGGWMFEDGAAK